MLESVLEKNMEPRVCSADFTVVSASAADLGNQISSSLSTSLAGDVEGGVAVECLRFFCLRVLCLHSPAPHQHATYRSHPWATGQKRFVSNVAGSLISLYTSSTDTVALDSIKGQALEFLSSSSTAPITDPAAATQAASALGALVTLPGALSPAQSASAAAMLGNFASSSLSILLSGAASVDFAIEVSPVLVGGAMGVLGKLSAGSRRLLAYKDGMSAAYAALASSAKVQAFALAASQAASVTEQAPSLVSAVRRLASSSTLAQLVPAAALLDVPVAVAPDADASVPAGALCVCARTCVLARTATTTPTFLSQTSASPSPSAPPPPTKTAPPRCCPQW